MSTFYKKGESYSIKVAEDKPKASFACYKYDKITRDIKPLTGCVAYNPLYLQYTNYDKDEIPPTSGLITIPKETYILYKNSADIYEINGKLMYTAQDLVISDNYTEKYNFNDITPTYKISIIQQVLSLNSSSYANFFKALSSSAKTEVDKEYCKYAREIGVITNDSIYNNMFMDKYFSAATSFKDLEQLLRYILYLNTIPRTSVIFNIYDVDYKPVTYYYR